MNRTDRKFPSPTLHAAFAGRDPADAEGQLALERLHYGMAQYVLPEELAQMHDLAVEPYIRDQLDTLMYGFEVKLYGQKLEGIHIDIRYPRDWWEALKERFAPAWVLRRWPVVYTVYERHVTVHALAERVRVPKSFGSGQIVVDAELLQLAPHFQDLERGVRDVLTARRLAS